jgi:Flp pilus assembly protein TadG
MVELAIAFILLMTMLMGIIEFGILYGNFLSLSEVARAGARSASLGSSVAVITNRVTTTAYDIGLSDNNPMSTALSYRTYDKASGAWSAWSALGDSGNYNSAPCNTTYDSQVKVRVAYTYPLLTGSFFSAIIGSEGNATINQTVIMRREETP